MTILDVEKDIFGALNDGFSKDSFYKTDARIGANPTMLVTAPYESTDIDTPDDWELGEVMVEYYRKKGILSEL